MRLAAALGGPGTSCRGAAGAGVWGGVRAAAGAAGEIGAADGMKAPAKSAAGGETGLAEGPKVAPNARTVRTTGPDAAKLGMDAPDPAMVGTKNPSSWICVGAPACGTGSGKLGMMSMALPWTGVPENADVDLDADLDADVERGVFSLRGPRPFRLRTYASSNKKKSTSPMTT